MSSRPAGLPTKSAAARGREPKYTPTPAPRSEKFERLKRQKKSHALALPTRWHTYQLFLQRERDTGTLSPSPTQSVKVKWLKRKRKKIIVRAFSLPAGIQTNPIAATNIIPPKLYRSSPAQGTLNGVCAKKIYPARSLSPLIGMFIKCATKSKELPLRFPPPHQ